MPPAERVRHPGLAAAYELADLDQQLADAQTRLRAARVACQRSPNAGTITAVHQAVLERDQLLDRRLELVKPRRPSTGS